MRNRRPLSFCYTAVSILLSSWSPSETPESEVQYSTCVDRLPAHGEWSPGLNDVHGDGAVVVRPGPPGELSRGVCDFIYSHGLWGAWRTWERARPSEVEQCVQMSKEVTTWLNGQRSIQLLIHPPPKFNTWQSVLNTREAPVFLLGSETT